MIWKRVPSRLAPVALIAVVAGSHRALVQPAFFRESWGLPAVPLPTRTGDVTVHCSCTLHMSRPPVSSERRVVYTGFNLAARPGDHRVEVSPEEMRRQRAALNDHTRRQHEGGGLSARVASHEL